MEDLDTLVLRQALAWQQAGEPVLLVTVARTWGSAPRPPGSLMAINGRGQTVGSVSGGCIEDDLIARVREGSLSAFQAATTAAPGATVVPGGDAAGHPHVNPGDPTRAPTVLRYGISADEAHRFGLPCGGTMELVLEPVSDRSRLGELLNACVSRRSTERVLDLHTGEVELRPGRRDGVPVLDEHHLACSFGPRARLILIGAGDLSRYLGEMAQSVGFEVIVCDPREDHRATWSLPGVEVLHEMPDDLIVRLRPDARTAVVTLTHDPKLDDLALIDALQSEAFYVGALGSRRNHAARCARLREHFGLSDEALGALRGPAGLYIGSKTPAEIALSILAEVVAAKNGVALPAQARVDAGKTQAERTSRHALTAPTCIA